MHDDNRPVRGFPSREAERQYHRERHHRRRLGWIAEQGGKCAQCGSSDDLQVDHIDPALKTADVNWRWPKAKLDAELANCQVLCHACHLTKTGKERPTWEHGTTSGYAAKCRCEPCRKAVREYHREYRERRALAGGKRLGNRGGNAWARRQQS